jgi:hypothetical protein
MRLLALVLLLAAAGCDLGGGESGKTRTTGSSAPLQSASSRGLTLEVPSGWSVGPPDHSAVSDPVVRAVLSSRPVESRRSRCQIASYAVPADAVVLVVVEWRESGARLRTRPQRFDARALRLARGAVECHAGRGGGTQFVESGRAFGAYLLLGDRAPDALAARARRVLDRVKVEPELPPPVELVPLATKSRASCRRSPLLRPVCPSRAPRVRAPYLSHLARDLARPAAQLDVFDLERGVMRAEHERNRPPAAAHLALLAGDTERIAPWSEPWGEPPRPLRDGVLRERRGAPVSFGLVDVGGRRALLFLAPPYPTGGYLGNHLVLVWGARGARRAVSLHAWEPLTEAVATLLRLVPSP